MSKAKPGPKKIRPRKGQVLILLSGRFRGHRVICLKNLQQGVFLVTGPYKINGVPLRRVNRRYCICTSTHIDLKGIDVNIPDDLFARKKGLRKAKGKKSKDETSGTTWLKRPRTHGKNKSEAAYFEEFEAQKKQSNLARKECQKQIDEPLIKRLKELDPLLPKYLSSIFTLQKGDRPHEMKF